MGQDDSGITSRPSSKAEIALEASMPLDQWSLEIAHMQREYSASGHFFGFVSHFFAVAELVMCCSTCAPIDRNQICSARVVSANLPPFRLDLCMM
jgi:hypothetical protein